LSGRKSAANDPKPLSQSDVRMQGFNSHITDAIVLRGGHVCKEHTLASSPEIQRIHALLCAPTFSRPTM
jgi:hypothetical protein